MSLSQNGRHARRPASHLSLAAPAGPRTLSYDLSSRVSAPHVLPSNATTSHPDRAVSVQPIKTERDLPPLPTVGATMNPKRALHTRKRSISVPNLPLIELPVDLTINKWNLPGPLPCTYSPFTLARSPGPHETTHERHQLVAVAVHERPLLALELDCDPRTITAVDGVTTASITTTDTMVTPDHAAAAAELPTTEHLTTTKCATRQQQQHPLCLHNSTISPQAMRPLRAALTPRATAAISFDQLLSPRQKQARDRLRRIGGKLGDIRCEIVEMVEEELVRVRDKWGVRTRRAWRAMRGVEECGGCVGGCHATGRA